MNRRSTLKAAAGACAAKASPREVFLELVRTIRLYRKAAIDGGLTPVAVKLGRRERAICDKGGDSRHYTPFMGVPLHWTDREHEISVVAEPRCASEELEARVGDNDVDKPFGIKYWATEDNTG